MISNDTRAAWKASRLAQRKLDNAAVEARFPKGSTKGDPLAGGIKLGGGYRNHDKDNYGSLKRSTGGKRWGQS